jgi:hypothetical protein
MGKCGRQLVYKYRGTVGIPLDWRSLSVFADGDLYHGQVRQWIHMSPRPDCFYLGDEETEVSLKTPKGRNIIGHVDGIIHHRAELLGEPYCTDPKHESKLLEVKSMSSKGFRALKWEGLEKSYVAQVSAYLMATGLREAIVVAKCKDTSELEELTLGRNDALVNECLEKFDSVIDASTPEDVSCSYRPNEGGALPWQCGYCPYWQTCWAAYKPIEKQAHKIVLTGDYKDIPS